MKVGVFRYHIRTSLAVIGVLLSALVVWSQTSSQNYVRTIEPLFADSFDVVPYWDMARISTAYYDGLGREVQRVDEGASPDFGDVATFALYDGLGRISRAYLPTVTGGMSGNFTPQSTFEQCSASFHGDSKAYILTEYEPSLLNRPAAVKGPGSAWHYDSHCVRHTYCFNDSTAKYSCRLYTVNGSSLVNSGIYAANTLRVAVTTDENGDSTAVFTDKAGREILSRRFHEYGNADTYWVYDIYGLLRYVLSPEASTRLTTAGTCNTDVLGRYAYYYAYDQRRRLAERRLPGCGAEYFVYNRIGQPIFTQDADQRTRGEWTVIKYDSDNRIAVEGTATMPAATRATLETLWGDSLLIEEKDTQTYNEYLLCYTNRRPFPDFTPHRAYFYDDYTHWTSRMAMPTSTGYYSGGTLPPAKGRLTGTAVTDFNGTTILTLSVTDRKGGETIAAECDYFGNDCRVVNFKQYDFRGNLTKRREEITDLAEFSPLGSISQEWRHTYDTRDRLVGTTHRVNDGAWTSISSPAYDYADRIVSDVTGPSGASRTTFGYNIRGWRTAISSPYYSQTISYDSLPLQPGQGGLTLIPNGLAARYDGSPSAVSETRWTESTLTGWPVQTDNDRFIAYDEFGRVSRTFDTDSMRFNERFDYDLNGNVTEIRRGNTAAPYEWAMLYYEGNQIDEIESLTSNHDYANGVPQLPVPSDVIYDVATFSVTHDVCGRVVTDSSRGINNIAYNPSGLPTRIDIYSFTDSVNGHAYNDQVLIEYRSDGVKRAETTCHRYMGIIVRPNGTTTRRLMSDIEGRTYRGSLVRTRSGGKRLYNERGFVDILTTAAGDSLARRFYVRDYLGNVRAVVDEAGTLLQATDYLAFGLPVTSLSTALVDNRLHEGNEFQNFRGLGWSDNTARRLDNILGRFTAIDPLAEKFPDISPYASRANSPFHFIDPDGKETYAYFSPKDMKDFNTAIRVTPKNNDVNIYAHGNKDGKHIHIYNASKSKVEKMDKDGIKRILIPLISKAKETSKKTVTVILNSCYSGNGESSIGQQLSSDLKDVTIIAPNGPLGIGIQGGVFPLKTNVKILKNNKSNWNVFRGGKLIGTLPSNGKHPTSNDVKDLK